MKKFQVWINNNAEYFCVESFDTLDEAKEYCRLNTEGLDLVDSRDNCYENYSNNFHYEVYDGAPVVISVGEEGYPLSTSMDAVYETEQFYCE